MPPRLDIDTTALLAMRDSGESHDAMAEVFDCSRSTIERRLLALPPRTRQCSHCVLDRDAEVARLRDAYFLMEEALLLLLNIDSRQLAGRIVGQNFDERTEHGKGQVSESSSPADSPDRRECVLTPGELSHRPSSDPLLDDHSCIAGRP